MKKTKQALFHSMIALILCFSMLVGTTFAWFTDTVHSGINTIVAGNLDVEIYHTNAAVKNEKVNSTTELFKDLNGEDILWEPGVVSYENLTVTNEGSLAFCYQLAIVTDNENFIVDGTNRYGLSQVLKVGVVEGGITAADRVGVLASVKEENWTTLGEFLRSGSLLNKGDATTWGIVIYWQPGENDNLWNLNNGKQLNEGEVLSIDLGIKLVATQEINESDSFGPDYDSGAEWPYQSIQYTVSASIADKINVATGSLTEDVMIGTTDDTQYAEIPANVKLADGAQKLTFTVTSMEKPNADVSTKTRDEVLRSVDIHVDGIAEDNTVPMTFVLKALFPTGLNDNNVKLYHVEGSETKEMTLVSNPVNHNEFSYDPLTGDAVITIATFSEVATYADTDAAWDGTTVTEYTVDGDTIKIANAQQFAYFRDQVDAGNDFAGKTVLLTADINLNDHNFDPIGWGYDNTAWNRDGAEGKVFKGTFDGDGYTIYGLYQSGWGLEASTGTDYTYTNCGGGLFASALDATFKNLTIDGARITFECVEIGVLVGLAQGSCTFENITIAGCKIANYQRPAGGVVGEVSPKVENGSAVESTHTFNNVYIDSNTVVGSLWGDFDTPVGGVIGTYWDDAGKTYISMTDVTVACELDVYNDVTSTYRWYAYRRAGMLIGNTYCSKKNESGTNIASTKINGTEHLTCSNVIVFYGDWANYHYCEFHDSNPKWPWVRVEPGENCSGYSNPRWGLATDPVTGEKVTDSVHNHGDGESHLTSIPFHQLYGGGQGVYGEETHDGVSEGIYTVTYMDRGEILHVDYVTDNTKPYEIDNGTEDGDDWSAADVTAANGAELIGWVDANNNEFTGVKANNTANVIVYPKWENEYVVRCIDTYGNVAYYEIISDANTEAYETVATNINNTLVNIQNEVDAGGKVMIIKWQDANGNLYETITGDMLSELSDDLILTAVPQLQETSITLTPYYDETTGELIAYHVTAVAKDDENINVVIPDYVGTVPITEISDSAAAGFDNLHSITIPNTITGIGSNALAEDWGFWDSGETITIYFEGSYEEWIAKEATFASDWDDGLGESSRIFFLNSMGKVDPSQGYLKAKFSYSWGITVSWSKSTVTNDHYNEYYNTCNCDSCDGADRPDKAYWEGVEIATTEQ